MQTQPSVPEKKSNMKVAWIRTSDEEGAVVVDELLLELVLLRLVNVWGNTKWEVRAVHVLP